ITVRLRHPRGIRRGDHTPGGTRLAVGAGGPPNRAVETEDQPSAKRRLFSAVVKLDGEEVREDLGAEDSKEEDPRVEASVVTNGERDEHKASYLRSNGVGFRKDGISRTRMTDFDMALPEPTPSESKLIQDANLVNRN
ncbi:hypothetical protein MUK42_09133, partial [Musa troglodytarum]